MNRALGVIGGGFGAGEFDGVDAAEVLELVARGFQPDVLDAGNFSSHVLDAIDGYFPVVIGDVVFEFVNYHVQKRFCTGAPRACRAPAAIPAANIAALSAICAARFIADVISSSVIETMPVYVRHAQRSNLRQLPNALAPANGLTEKRQGRYAANADSSRVEWIGPAENH